MTPQELKNSILQLAIQGKLVPQRAEEGTAEELYNQIQAEKQKLIKAGKIKKEKPLPAIPDDEKPFEIPDSWKWVRIGEIFHLTMGQSPKGTSVSEEADGIEFHQGKIYFGIDYLKKSQQRTIEVTKIAEPNSILLCVRAPVGLVNIVDRKICIGRGLCAINSYNSISEKFMLYFIRAFQSSFIKKATGTTFKAISNIVITNQVFPLPPLAEQKRIMAKIEKLLPYVERYEKAYNELQQLNKRFPVDLQKSVLQLAIQGRLVSQCPEEGNAEDLYKQIQAEKQNLIKAGKIKKEKPLPAITDGEKPFEIPDSWKWVRLGDLVVYQGGYAYKSNSYVQDSNNQIIRLGNIKQGQLLLEIKPVYISDEIAIETENYKIKSDDILVTMTGTRRKKDYFYVTRIAQKDIKNKNLYLNQRVGCFRVICGLIPDYLLKVMQSEITRELIFKKETGTANQGNLGSEDMKKFIYIPLPPLAEQKRIVAKLEEILPLCDKLK